MTIKVTDEAKKEVNEIVRESGLKNPAIRLKFNGFG
jgi:Fe-S cluster assembly iron-binding protein IscA